METRQDQPFPPVSSVREAGTGVHPNSAPSTEGVFVPSLGLKNPPANAGDVGSIPGSRRSPWRRKWQPPPVFLPGDPIHRGAWWATVHGVAKSHSHLSDYTAATTGLPVPSLCSGSDSVKGMHGR